MRSPYIFVARVVQVVPISLGFATFEATAANWPEGYEVREKSQSANGHYAITLLLAEEATNFPSPDGRFALSLGSYETGHRDPATQEWITDGGTKPAAIIDHASHTVLLQLESPLRPQEDKVLWSADSKWLAFNHRGNKQTDLTVCFWNGASFEKVKLPDLPGPELKFRPDKKPLAEQVVHFDEDTVTPLRWLKSGALIVSRKSGMTDNTVGSVSYSRVYTITIGFDGKQVGHVENVIKQKQQVEAQ